MMDHQHLVLRAIAREPRMLAKQVFGPAWTTEDGLRPWVWHHTRTYWRQLRNARNANSAGGPKRRAARNKLLNSSSAKICCLIKAAAKRGKTFTRKDIEAVAGGLRAWKDCGEKVFAHAEKKEDGTSRWTWNMGPKRLALAYVCRNLLVAAWGYPAGEYSCKGRGSHFAIERLISGINKDRPWFFQADIKKFHSSFGQDAVVKAVPLSEYVVRNAILAVDAEIALPDGLDDPGSVMEALRAGLPQGSPVSHLIASHLLSQVIEPIAFDTWLGHYSDNLFGICDSKEDAAATLIALNDALAASPLGEFAMHKEQVRYTDQGVTLLGYLITTWSNQDQYDARAFPSIRARNRFFGELKGRLGEISPSQVYDEAERQTLEWLTNFPACKSPSTAWTDQLLNRAYKAAKASIGVKSPPTLPKATPLGVSDPTAPPWGV